MILIAHEIANLVGGVVEGDDQSKITKLSKIESGDHESLTFLGNSKYTEYLYSSNASIIIVREDLVLKEKIKPTLIRVKDPNYAFSKLLSHFNNTNTNKVGIDEKSSLHSTVEYGDNLFFDKFCVAEENVVLGENVKIHSQVYLGRNVVIGNNTIIYPGVKIYSDSIIGDNCIIHSGTVIGSDGFGFNFDSNGNTTKVIHNGNVVIENDVEIGSNCTIDRATLGSTLIKRGAKLDNLVQIAHNVVIGCNTCLAAQVGVAGSTVIGNNCLIGGQVGIAGHLKIGDNVQMQAKSGVLKNIKSGSVLMGYPAINYMDFNKSFVHFKNLPKVMGFIYNLMKKKDVN
jgi:UDP-3-O-[3-hydroxymyristoyl] glucosamine N-acyltransferase